MVDFPFTHTIIGEKKMAQVKGLADENYTGNLSMQKYSIACRKELNKLTVHQIITKHEVYLGI